MAQSNWLRIFDKAVEISVCTPKQSLSNMLQHSIIQYLNTMETDFTLHQSQIVLQVYLLNFTLNAMQAVSVFAEHLTNKPTSLMNFKKVYISVMLPSTWTYVLIWDVASCVLPDPPEHANYRMLFLYALTCLSATVCNLTAAVQYIVANLHYACHTVE